MASLTTYTFSKRHNSTKQPTGGTDITVNLKGGSDLLTPTFLLNSAAIPSFNYMKFDSRYYFVTGIKNVRDQLYEVSGKVDVMATWKSAITAADAYVLYYSHNNTEITDSRLAAKTTQVTQSNNAAFTYFGAGFTTVLFAVGKDHIAAYKIGMTDIKRLISSNFYQKLEDDLTNVNPIDTSSVPNAISDAGRFIVELLQTAALSATYVGKIADCIRNVYILPIDPTGWGGALEDVYLGKSATKDSLDNNIQGYALGALERTLSDSAVVQIPWQASDWRRNAPYHEIYLYIPCIGMTTLSPSDLIGEDYIHVDMSLDKISGDVIFNVGTTSKVIAQYTTNVAVNYPIGSSNIDPSKVVNAIGNSIGEAAGGSNPFRSAANIGLGLANAITPQPMSIGSNGGGAFLGLVGYTGNKIYCFTVFHDTSVNPHGATLRAVQGEPFNGAMSLNISGYVQTSGASVAGNMTDTEREEINSILDGGAYIE